MNNTYLDETLFIKTHLANEKEMYILFHMIAKANRHKAILDQLRKNEVSDFFAAEYTLEEAATNYLRSLKKATSRILKLNSLCIKAFGQPFIQTVINIKDVQQCFNLLDAVSQFLWRSAKIDINTIKWLQRLQAKEKED